MPFSVLVCDADRCSKIQNGGCQTGSTHNLRDSWDTNRITTPDKNTLSGTICNPFYDRFVSEARLKIRCTPVLQKRVLTLEARFTSEARIVSEARMKNGSSPVLRKRVPDLEARLYIETCEPYMPPYIKYQLLDESNSGDWCLIVIVSYNNLH